MTEFNINWSDGIAGGVEIRFGSESNTCANLEALGDFIKDHGSRLTLKEAKLVGVIAFYFALRDFGMGTPCTVLDGAARGLDSAYIVIQKPEIQARINEGIESVRAALFSIRDRSYEELAQRAYHFMRSLLLE
jgi:hypothetical protein